MRTVAFCEIEKFPRQVLRKHWPDVPIFDDVRKLHAEDLPETVDIICGGYPCQPFSVAGKRRGKEDDRHLWPEMFRLIRECMPSWVVAENVAGHVSMGLDQVLSDLEGEGYAGWPFIIPACAINAPHRRDRLWIIAYSECNGRTATKKSWGTGEAIQKQQSRKDNTFNTERAGCLPAPGQNVANTIEQRLPRRNEQGEAAGKNETPSWCEPARRNNEAYWNEWPAESPVC